MNFEDAKNIVDGYSLHLLDQPGVVAVAVGTKDGGPVVGARDFCVAVYVEKKLPETALIRTAGDALLSMTTDRDHELLADSGSDAVNVVESGGRFQPLPGLQVPANQRGQYGGAPPTLDLQKRFQSPRAGIGITNPFLYPRILDVGTLGFFARDDKGTLYLISNNHVIGRSNAAALHEPIVQPGTLDLTQAELARFTTVTSLATQFEIARFTAAVPLQFPNPSATPHNRVDAAAAELLDAVDRSQMERVGLAGRMLGVAAPYDLDQNGTLVGPGLVYKMGRTTGLTEGDVVSVAGRSTVGYPGGTALFVDQIIVAATADNGGPFSAAGDSGSPVLNGDHELVGLLFAGSPNQTLVNPISYVLNELCSALGVSHLTPV